MSHPDLNREMTGFAGMFGMFTKNTAVFAFASDTVQATVLRDRHVASLHALASTERQTRGKFACMSICKSTERQSCCKFACVSSCKSTERQTCCKFACISICKSTERQTCCN